MRKGSSRAGKKREIMDAQVMEQLAKFHRVEELLKKLTLAEAVLSILVLGRSMEITAIYMLVTLPVLILLSGYTAHLHRMLPKKYQKKPNCLSMSHFGVHPDVTFWVFFVLFAICLGTFLPRVLYMNAQYLSNTLLPVFAKPKQEPVLLDWLLLHCALISRRVPTGPVLRRRGRGCARWQSPH